MKMMLALLMILLASWLPHSLDAEDNPDAEDLFVSHVKRCLARYDVPVSSEQEHALRIVYPMLRQLSKEGVEAHRLWVWVGLEDPVDIDMERAKELILSGKIRFLLVNHSERVDLSTHSGLRYRVHDPGFTLFEVVRSVDPQHVFIGMLTE